jgi:hypothetical protein
VPQLRPNETTFSSLIATAKPGGKLEAAFVKNIQ